MKSAMGNKGEIIIYQKPEGKAAAEESTCAKFTQVRKEVNRLSRMQRSSHEGR